MAQGLAVDDHPRNVLRLLGGESMNCWMSLDRQGTTMIMTIAHVAIADVGDAEAPAVSSQRLVELGGLRRCAQAAATRSRITMSPIPKQRLVEDGVRVETAAAEVVQLRGRDHCFRGPCCFQ
jgi:hypothetical protein